MMDDPKRSIMEETSAYYNDSDTRTTTTTTTSNTSASRTQCVLCHSYSACSGHIQMLQATCGICLHAHAIHHHELQRLEVSDPEHQPMLMGHHELRSSASDTTVGANDSTLQGNPIPQRSSAAATARGSSAAAAAAAAAGRDEPPRRDKKKEKRPSLATTAPAEPSSTRRQKGEKEDDEEDGTDSTIGVMDTDSVTDIISPMTRSVRQKLSLPLPESQLYDIACTPNGLATSKKGAGSSRPNRRRSRMTMRKNDRPPSTALFEAEQNSQASGSRGPGTTGDESTNRDDEAGTRPADAATGDGGTDRNHNAKKEDKTDKGDKNGTKVTTSPKKRPNSPRYMLNKGHPSLKKAAHFEIPAQRMVSLSGLKPIKATCSQSGMGLVVTYRPVFSDVAKRVRKKPVVSPLAAAACTDKDSVRPTARRETGTDPRTPSPSKRNKEPMASPSDNDRFKIVKKRKGAPDQKDKGVKKWLDDNVPQTSSDRTTKHREKEKERGKKANSKQQKGSSSGYKPLVIASCPAARKKQPIPGPSWNPAELQQHPAFSREGTPFDRSSNASSPSPYGTTWVEPHLETTSTKSKSGGKLMDAAMTELLKADRARSQSPPSTRAETPDSSEGWDIPESLSPEKKPKGSRSGGKGKGGDRDRDDRNHNDRDDGKSRGDRDDRNRDDRDDRRNRGDRDSRRSRGDRDDRHRGGEMGHRVAARASKSGSDHRLRRGRFRSRSASRSPSRSRSSSTSSGSSRGGRKEGEKERKSMRRQHNSRRGRDPRDQRRESSSRRDDPDAGACVVM